MAEKKERILKLQVFMRQPAKEGATEESVFDEVVSIVCPTQPPSASEMLGSIPEPLCEKCNKEMHEGNCPTCYLRETEPTAKEMLEALREWCESDWPVSGHPNTLKQGNCFGAKVLLEFAEQWLQKRGGKA